MKKLILSLGILLSGVSIVSVQAGNIAFVQAGLEANSAKRFETIKSVCKTTPEQNAKLENVFREYDGAEDASRKANKGDSKAMVEATRKNNHDLDEKLGKILTPEQSNALREHDLAGSKDKK
jgi:hypothetical protein